MAASKTAITAYLTVGILVLDLTAEAMRLAVCVATPPGATQQACYSRIGPVSQAFQKLRIYLESKPPEVAPPAPAPPPVVVPRGGSTMEQLRKQPSL